MAAICNNDISRATSFHSKLHFLTMQTVMPIKQTDPMLSARVVAAGDDQSLGSSTYKRCFNIVLCYNKASEDDSGSLMAAWIKESLSRALSGEPILAGRLKRKDEAGELEIISNDSGVRLIEAELEMGLQEFIDWKDKKEAEAELVYWEDIDHDPQFSPLIYIQVTSFKCGGYSIGISCSPLLLDPFSMVRFLKKWTDVHIKTISETGMPKIPAFYRPHLRNRVSNSHDLPIGSCNKPNTSKSVIFNINIATKILNLDKEIHTNIAARCIDEAELKLGQKPASKYSLFVREDQSSGDVKVQTFSREGFIVQKPSTTTVNGITVATWDDLGAENIHFNEGNKPAYVSCWISSVVDEAIVIIVPPTKEDGAGMKIVFSI